MGKRIYLHIGTHKTGSTSIQRCCFDHRDVLAEHGIAFAFAERQRIIHNNLYLAAMRPERDSFAKLKSEQVIGPDYVADVEKEWHEHLSELVTPGVLMTSEGLGLLRFDDEIERLRRIVRAEAHEVRVIVYLRNKSDFLRSYTRQIRKRPGREPSDDPSSCLYVEPDSWLVDYERLLEVYRRGFGERNVRVIDYDEQVASVGSVVPSFLEALGIPSSAIDGAMAYRENVSVAG